MSAGSAIPLLAVAAGGALGAVMRYLLGGAVQALARGAGTAAGAGFPFGTLAVNLLGSGAMGVAYALLVERGGGSESWRLFLLTGVLGGFTTFSAFSIETVALLHQGASGRAMSYAAASLIGCVLAAWAGVEISRQL